MKVDGTIEAAADYFRAGRLAEAEQVCRRLIEVGGPADPRALHLLGMVCQRDGRTGEALEFLARVVDVAPDVPEFRSNLAAVLGHVGRAGEAVEHLSAAIRLRPQFADAHNNLGVALESLVRLEEAAAAYREAIRQRPDWADAHLHLGNALRKLGRPWEAAEAYRASARLRPEVPAPYYHLGNVCLAIGRQTEALEHCRRWFNLQPESAPAQSDLVFWLLHDPTCSQDEAYREHLRWSERHELPHPSVAVAPHANDRDPDRPLRVGYVSADFREHPAARFLEPVLTNHNAAQVSPVCYSDVEHPDATTRRMKSYSLAWRDTAGLPHDRFADLVRRDRIDILVDPTGHMGGNRLPAFARRPAPIQVTYLYPSSTGMRSMDWRITDEVSDPPGMTERWYTERLLRLPTCAWCYRPDDDVPPVTPLPALSNTFVTFGSLNRMAKVSPPVVALWARVLATVPSSRLLVLAQGGESNTPVRHMFEQHGVAGERLMLVPTGARSQYLALAHRVDIALDPFPYAGMTTVCDFLWQGVPTVALVGDRPQSRMGASILRTVGLDDLVAPTEADYVRTANELAHDLSRLLQIRTTLRDRMRASAVCDGPGLAARLDRAFRGIWRHWCERIARI